MAAEKNVSARKSREVESYPNGIILRRTEQRKSDIYAEKKVEPSEQVFRTMVDAKNAVLEERRKIETRHVDNRKYKWLDPEFSEEDGKLTLVENKYGPNDHWYNIVTTQYSAFDAKTREPIALSWETERGYDYKRYVFKDLGKVEGETGDTYHRIVWEKACDYRSVEHDGPVLNPYLVNRTGADGKITHHVDISEELYQNLMSVANVNRSYTPWTGIIRTDSLVPVHDGVVPDLRRSALDNYHTVTARDFDAYSHEWNIRYSKAYSPNNQMDVKPVNMSPEHVEANSKADEHIVLTCKDVMDGDDDKFVYEKRFRTLAGLQAHLDAAPEQWRKDNDGRYDSDYLDLDAYRGRLRINPHDEFVPGRSFEAVDTTTGKPVDLSWDKGSRYGRYVFQDIGTAQGDSGETFHKIVWAKACDKKDLSNFDKPVTDSDMYLVNREGQDGKITHHVYISDKAYQNLLTVANTSGNYKGPWTGVVKSGRLVEVRNGGGMVPDVRQSAIDDYELIFDNPFNAARHDNFIEESTALVNRMHRYGARDVYELAEKEKAAMAAAKSAGKTAGKLKAAPDMAAQKETAVVAEQREVPGWMQDIVKSGQTNDGPSLQ